MSFNFRSTTWFVTGATGLVGSYIVEKLRENDLSVIALVRTSSPQHMINWLQKIDVKLVYGDLLEPETYENILPTCDIVVHSAAAVQVRDVRENWNVNYQGTKFLLERMMKYGVKRLIHISTAGVYGIAKKELVDESVDPKPYGAYLESKFAAEKVIIEHSESIKSTIIRPPFIHGSVERDRHTIPTLVKHIPKSFMPKIVGNDTKIGFVHAEDIAKMVLLVGAKSNTPSVIYNVQSFEINLTQLIEMINNARSSSTRILPVPFFVIYSLSLMIDGWFRLKGKPFGLHRRVLIASKNWIFSTTLAENELGWSRMHRDSNELEILMTEYVQRKNYKKEDQDIRNLIEESV